jgi:ubiquitin C-terminal hydrolase
MKGECGLHNVGNTCYLNAAVQCLRHCLDTSKYFLSENYKGVLKDNILERDIVQIWHVLLYNLWSKDEPINPSDFVRHFIKCSQNSGYSTFVSFQQNDVDEFITNLINILHNGISQKIEYNISGEAKNEYDKHALEAYKRWKEYFENDYSIFIKHFYSQYISKTTCKKCDNVSFNYDPFLVCHLPVPEKEDVTLYDCLDLFINEEDLDDDNQWKCDKCSELSCATRSTKLWDTSKYFIIILKNYTKNNKRDGKIEIPETIDLDKYAINYRSGKSKYELFGICHHSGSLGGGHYYASCKTNGKWIVYNDSSANEIEKLDTKNAYCLFYNLI